MNNAPTMKQRKVRIIFVLAVVSLVGLLLYRGCLRSDQYPLILSGPTMGTVYHITVRGDPQKDIIKIQKAINNRLDEINRSMSTWIEDSEISKINKMPEGEWVSVSEELSKVLQASMQLSEKTGGAFDATIGPLVNLWGFGPEDKKEIPSSEQIQKALDQIGYQNLNFIDGRLKKNRPNMSLDFSAIAKGYGVDELAVELEKMGIENYSVEIGGEVVVKGVNPQGKSWTVGIETPKEGALLGEDFVFAVSLTSGALATSGTYRIFLEDDSGKGSHIINPKNGEAIYSNLVSVTVYAPTCMEADGIATALMVMGVEEGLKWIENQPGIEVLFLVKKSPSEFDQIMSSGFSGLTTVPSS